METAKEWAEYFAKLPPDTKVHLYNNDAMKHGPVSASYYDEKSSIGITNTVILSSSIIVTVED